MPIVLYYLSGSPYAWRVWLALEHKGIPYELKTMSYDAGDFKLPEFRALNPRGRVPVIADESFVLYESAAIVEYLDDRAGGAARLFSADVGQRAVQRRMVREADQYFAAALEELVEAVLFTPRARWSRDRIDTACAALRKELAFRETIVDGDYLAGPLSAADFTLFPEIALARRIAERNADIVAGDLIGPNVSAWMQRMESLACVQKTWPPHWRG